MTTDDQLWNHLVRYKHDDWISHIAHFLSRSCQQLKKAVRDCCFSNARNLEVTGPSKEDVANYGRRDNFLVHYRGENFAALPLTSDVLI